MVPLSRAITDAIVYEYGQKEFLRRISDPYFFQALSCAIGFDWNSSGTTTTTCGALKEALKGGGLGVTVCGGKGSTSRKTPEEIGRAAEQYSLGPEKLVYASRMAAKVDNSCIQDGFQLYHHVFFLSENGDWAVVQQGLDNTWARRYHWLSDNVKSFVDDPQTGIACDFRKDCVLDMTARESEEARKVSLDLVNDNPLHLKKYFSGQKTLTEYTQYDVPLHHPVLRTDISERGWEVLRRAYELQPESYEELVSLNGMGPKKIRALALLSDLIYGAQASWKDPVKYSFAHGGKDGYPYPVSRDVYDHSIGFLKGAIEQAKLGNEDKYKAIKRLKDFI
jgi:hypothetical protein